MSRPSAQAAEALRPIAGEFAFVVFALGIVGTGMLGGSSAGRAPQPTRFGEALQWPTGLARLPKEARGVLRHHRLRKRRAFGLWSINFNRRSTPIKALFWAAVLNGRDRCALDGRHDG